MARGSTYYIDISHDGLNKFRRITGTDRGVVEEKANRQLAIWDELWEKRLTAETKREAREEAALEREAKKELAAERTDEAQKAIAALEGILEHTLKVNDTINWEALKHKGSFQGKKPPEPEPSPLPLQPQPQDPDFRPNLGFLDRLISSRRAKKEQAASARYEEYRREWERQTTSVQAANQHAQDIYRKACVKWEEDRRTFEENKAAHNQSIDARRADYEAGNPEAIEEYCDLVLSNSMYPEPFPSEFEVEYRPEGKIVLVDYQLPAPEAVPRLREVKYVQSRDEFIESFLPDTTFNKLYDSCLYQIALRTVHELLEADQIGAIEAVLFNGWVRSTDKATGNETAGCIISLQVSKDEFGVINLAQVDPKACFRSLKGVGSAKLHGLSAVRPILELNRDDSRFINAREVVDSLSEGDNLAAMDWEDFEHLIREVFEKEFAQGGGEVKITQASKDRGVDAVVFDPDPIRGGKIVIQAKRYTSTVGVSAVRDLYGTIMNEGAMKGILVTTSDYGPDAYEFARDKPLTLLSGANLLHMLERHGHRARINLQEAKELLKNQ